MRNHHRPRLGVQLSQDTKQRISEAKLVDNPGYSAIHVWLLTNYEKSGICSECGEHRKTDWANISGEYHRERSDFRELCRSCHKLEHSRIRSR